MEEKATPLRLLLVEDSADDAALLLREVRLGGYALTTERVDQAAAMREALSRQPWDLIIADYVLPRFSALAALEIAHQSGLDLPFIIVSGVVGEETAVTALKAGAHDFILKSHTARLLPAIARELREAQERRARRAAEQALQDQQQRVQALIEHASDLILVLDPTGVITYTSPSTERVVGYAPAALVGRPLAAFLPPHEWDEFVELLAYLQQYPRVLPGMAFQFQHHDTSWRVLDAVVNNLLDNPFVQGIVVNARDNTDRTRAEEQRQRQLARIASLRMVDMTISASLDLRVTLSVVLEQVLGQLAVDAAAVLLLDARTQTLAYTAERGFPHSAGGGLMVRLTESTAGRAVLERRIIRIPNLALAEDLAHSPLLEHADMVAYYGVPLIAKGQVKGVLELFHRAPLEPDAEWFDFLETLAGQTALAVDNAGLFDDLQRSNLELALAYDTTLEGWSRALDLRDEETEGHSRRVTDVTLRLARTLGVASDDLVHMRRGALLHDIGKMGIPDSILLKPGPLTEDEWATMRNHPIYAYELLAPISFLRPALDIPYCHHERWDGGGYPRGLKGVQIPDAARIFAVVDVWDALRSRRRYRPPWPEHEVRRHLRALSGTHFEPRVVESFLNLSL
ncbi:MAG TPA: HD domain-containing phosphohydrolase [Chloroflexia bacterium]|nr:HD domain-containing phosphohydrolase [Chloroflexia bacterium]